MVNNHEELKHSIIKKKKNKHNSKHKDLEHPQTNLSGSSNKLSIHLTAQINLKKDK